MRCRGISLRNLQVREAPLAHFLVSKWRATSCMTPTGRSSRQGLVHSVFSPSLTFLAPTSSHRSHLLECMYCATLFGKSLCCKVLGSLSTLHRLTLLEVTTLDGGMCCVCSSSQYLCSRSGFRRKCISQVVQRV